MQPQWLPDTPRARVFRKLLSVLWVASIAGVTLVLNTLLGSLMDVGFRPARLQLGMLAFNATVLCGWGLIGWVAYRGSRRGLAPPAWAYVGVIALMWGAILLDRLG